MKTIEITKDLPAIEELLKMASGENIILRLPDGQEFLLAEINDFNREIELTRENTELMKFLSKLSRNSKTFSLDKVRDQLGSK